MFKKEKQEVKEEVKDNSSKRWICSTHSSHNKVVDWLNEMEKKHKVIDFDVEFRGLGSYWVVFIKVE